MDESDPTLSEVQAWLQERLATGQMVDCPACRQPVKIYAHTIGVEGARVLIDIYQEDRINWVKASHLPSYRGGDSVKTRHWGLIEKAMGLREDGSNRNGYWRLTTLGRAYVEDGAKVPEKVYTFNGEALSPPSGQPKGIREALGTKFDYDQLMGRR